MFPGFGYAETSRRAAMLAQLPTCLATLEVFKDITFY
jgi:hypothetical protein